MESEAKGVGKKSRTYDRKELNRMYSPTYLSTERQTVIGSVTL